MKESDRYFTSPEIMALVLEQWGEVDLDPCWDPLSIVVATNRYDIREGQDGLVLPWTGKVFLNPPYSDPAPWLARAAQHAAAGGEVLAIVNAGTGTKTWMKHVWPYTRVCFLSPRPKFSRPSGKETWNSADSAVLYYGPYRQRFREIWRGRGQIVGGLDQSGALYGPSARNLAREP